MPTSAQQAAGPSSRVQASLPPSSAPPRLLARLQASKLGATTRARLPSAAFVAASVRNANWVLLYWAGLALDELLGGDFGFEESPTTWCDRVRRHRRVVFTARGAPRKARSHDPRALDDVQRRLHRDV